MPLFFIPKGECVKKVIFWSLLFCSFLQGDEDHEPLYILEGHDPPHVIEAHLCYEKTDALWDRFNDEVAWLLKREKPPAAFPSSDPEEKALNESVAEKWKQDYEEFVQEVTKANESFFRFRQQVTTSLSARIEANSHKSLVEAVAGLELTQWYVSFMEENLFGYGWQERYLKDKEVK